LADLNKAIRKYLGQPSGILREAEGAGFARGNIAESQLGELGQSMSVGPERISIGPHDPQMDPGLMTEAQPGVDVYKLLTQNPDLVQMVQNYLTYSAKPEQARLRRENQTPVGGFDLR
jgi:hypothetical protein